MKKLSLILIALIALTQTAWAQDVNYIECSWTGSNTTGHVVKTTKTYTGSYTTYNSNNEDVDTFNDGWYVLSGSFTFKKRICIDGDVKIILADGCTATFKMGICIKPGKTLTIYAQSDGDNKGYLNAEMNDFEGFENESIGDDLAAIGGNPDEVGGSLVIHGGHIYAKPVENNAAGIGGSEGSDSNGKSTGMESVTIYDGTIEAKGKSSGAGIGCGEKNSNPPTVTIYGGNITAKGGKYAAGIGGSEDCSNGTIKIYGGTVNATGGEEGTGIGSGDTNMSNPIYIYGGTVTATGGKNGAGIGSGFRGDMSANIYIYRGTITATGGNGGAGIGSGRRGSQTSTIYIYGGTVTAKGGEYGGAGIGSGLGDNDDLVSAGRIKIYDGEVYATGGAGNAGSSGGAGIGGGGCGNGGTLTVYSGYVEAKSNGAEAAAIGGGSSGKGGNSYFYGGTVKAILTNEAQHGSNNKNFAYIGRGGSSSDLDMGHVYFGTDMMVSTDGTKASASERESACQTQPGAVATTLTITTCEHSFTYSEYDYQHHFRSTCPYCNISSDYDFHTYGSDGHTCTLCGFNATDPKTLTFYEANAGGTGYEVTTTETHERLTERKLPSYTNVPSRLAFEGWVKVDEAPGVNEALTVVTDEQAASMTIYKSGQTYTVVADAIFKAVYKNGWDGEGSGTEADPYIISTIADFNQLASITASCYYYDGKYFRMDADLDFTGESFTPVGNSTKPFKGILDGEGHSISGINVQTADTYKALFGIVHGTVKNLTLTNSTFKANTNVGGIVCENWGTIENCHVTSSVSIEYYSGNGGNFGGIVGSNNGTVDGCTSAATVDGKTKGKVGGIVGYNEGTLKNSLYYGNNVINGEYVGAIVGWEHTSLGTLTSNYYVPWTDGPAAVVNMGSSSSQDVSGAKAGYTVTTVTTGLTLDFGDAIIYEYGGVKVYDFGLSYDGVLYSGNGQQVTFTPLARGYLVSDIQANGTALTPNSDGSYTITMGTANVSITAGTLTPAVTRIVDGYGSSSDNDKWAFIASPVATEGGIAPTAVSGLVGTYNSSTGLYNYDLYRLNPSTMWWENYNNPTHHDEFVLENGMGYLYASKQRTELVFTGAFNEGTTMTVELREGWNLVGNPFTEEAYVNRPFYQMNDAGSAIVAIDTYNDYTPIDIPACTGIILHAESDSETVTFSTTEPELEEANNNQGSLRITLSQVVEPVEEPVNKGDGSKGVGPSTGSGTLTLDNAIITFNEGSQLGKFYFGKQNANIYIPQGGKEYAIISVPAGRDAARHVSTNEIPINFKAKENGTYKISVNPEGVEMGYLHLIDNMTGADVDLLALRQAQGPASYTFTAKTTDYTSRFKLVFAVNDGSSTGSETFAFISNGNIIITGEGTLQVVDMMGRVIVSRDAARYVSTNGMAPGVYVLRLIDGENIKVQKIVIR